MKQFLPLVFFLAAGLMVQSCAYLNGNFRSVQDGNLYRSGQLHARALERQLEAHDILTVISLRSAAPGEAWYHGELAVCDALRVGHYSLDWSKDHLPSPDSLALLVELLGDAPRPILVHCQGGVHRSSIASAIFVLMQGGDTEAARSQIHPRFHDAPIGRLLELYAQSELPFGRWALEAYPALYEREL